MSNLLDFGKNFDEKISVGVVVVDFWATWCGPCRMLSPILDEVSKNNANVSFGQVDVDKYPEIAERFSVNSIPNVCLFVNGKLADRSVGLVTADEMESFINKHVN